MKLMYAVWGSTLDDALREPELHGRLAAAGADAVQLNLCDADVRAAQLRHSTYDEPVAAIVSVWCEADHDPVTGALAAVSDAVNGWIVEERVPLAPPPTENGTRCDALSNIALLRTPPDMERADWLRYWHDKHTAVAIETQATFGYVQNTVVAALTPGRRVDAVVEELFPMAAMTDRHAFWGSGGDEAELQRRVGRMMDSVNAFGVGQDLDVIPTSRYHYRLSPESR
ncbi:EthD domain-containing protein [Nocardia wallacei]|uniref:EthD domain-containing protein n=1 Tax=Nocardia wallacei TaxID=480035 RepID=UPI0024548B43|nr:EthD domain-containing protein [Nocardia wallacei]